MALTFPERRTPMNKSVELVDMRSEYPTLLDFTQVYFQAEASY